MNLTNLKPDAFYSTAHVAKALGVAPRTVRAWIEMGKIRPAFGGRDGIHARFSGDDIRKFAGYVPVPQTETIAERRKRIKKAMQEIIHGS